ncbi:PH domain-containing protein [uncultured Mycolicibacterium sp.]|uniref:PH domain-containing protein n=1 Tax=uncultured Mycolicibacterium sp. TaxID=2320817 RepID=UPI002607D605|nr:PH domain-containing protein [uncultured Mycolicibacterium sp.]
MSERRWDVEIRPHRTPVYAWIIAVVLAATGVVLGLLLKIRSTGVVFQTADQIAFGLLGVLMGAAVLLLTRPRLRIGPDGLLVRNILGDKLIPWDDVVDVWFPPGARWARVELPADEYIPLMAIQSVDKERAIEAMDRVRAELDRYRPDISST